MDDGLLAFLVDELAPLGTIKSRRMFGGATLYCDGTVFALLADDALFLKADAELAPRFAAAGLPQFTYDTKDGRNVSMTYWKAPEAVFDDNDELLDWCRQSLAAARRIEAAKPVRAPRARRGATKA